MNRFIAVCAFVLSLYGCNAGGSTFVHRTQANGTDALYSKVVARGGVTRFHCLRSASGRCHYRVFASECASTSTSASKTRSHVSGQRCRATPIARFAIADGNSRTIPGLQVFNVCVSAQDEAPGPDCKLPEPLAG